MTAKSNQSPNPAARQVNPIVKAAAEQVQRSKNRPAKPKPRELPRWSCRDQLSLFDPSEATE
ncbi:hypothetical protein [Nocardia sp. alder85J]|uniref:hypothetical protein n=1 Tax=Nocardia sp. alder85J TaxID=2862949 RepID=UPI001CD65C84|nr:hypothetical protein [Nocardia sp. alder85J]MCX4093662.1 hypothetical protein [Nocardia sp. alder85J]